MLEVKEHHKKWFSLSTRKLALLSFSSVFVTVTVLSFYSSIARITTWDNRIHNIHDLDYQNRHKLNITLLSENMKKYVSQGAIVDNDTQRIMLKWQLDDDKVSRAYSHLTSTARLERKFTEVMLSGRNLVIGVTGGSISTATAVGKQHLYLTTLTELLQRLLGMRITLKNAAIGATSTTFALYCLDASLDLDHVDIILWEYAYNDRSLKVGCSPQEEFTRKVLKLHNPPQLIFVNFMMNTNLKSKNCLKHHGYTCSRPLSEHYNIPSISFQDVICDQIKNGNYSNLLSPLDKSHPSVKMHDMMALFLFQFFRMAFDKTIRDIALGIQIGNPISIFESTSFSTVELPRRLFNGSHIFKSYCFAMPMAEIGNRMPLKVVKNQNWTQITKNNTLLRVDKKQFWASQKPNATIVFELDVDDFGNNTYQLKIFSLGCKTCGNALVWLDEDVEHKNLMSTGFKFGFCRLHNIMHGVKVGKHRVNIQAIANTVQIIAVIAVDETEI